MKVRFACALFLVYFVVFSASPLTSTIGTPGHKESCRDSSSCSGLFGLRVFVIDQLVSHITGDETADTGDCQSTILVKKKRAVLRVNNKTMAADVAVTSTTDGGLISGASLYPDLRHREQVLAGGRVFLISASSDLSPPFSA